MSYQKLSRDQIAQRVAQDIPDGAYVNLGIGLPTKIASYLPADKDVFLHSENGLGPIMAMAADVTIAQVSEVVELGGLDPEHIITPGIFVQHVVQVQPAQ